MSPQPNHDLALRFLAYVRHPVELNIVLLPLFDLFSFSGHLSPISGQVQHYIDDQQSDSSTILIPQLSLEPLSSPPI